MEMSGKHRRVKKAAVKYEAFFLYNDEIINLFYAVRGTVNPYTNLTKLFHVTTRYMPEHDMRELYGTEVTVHIFAYKNGTAAADDGGVTSNEGFFCTVSSDNPRLQQFIDGLNKRWHITGSYEHNAKYTEYLDLTDAEPVDFTVLGRFGGFFTDGQVYFSDPSANNY